MLKKSRDVDIVLNDDVIQNILLRVPCFDGHLRLRAVCKRWLAIIDDPHFRYLLHQRWSARLPTAFLFSSPRLFQIVRFPVEEWRHSSRSLWVTGTYNQPDSTPSSEGLVCVYNIRMRELKAWNPITGEALALSPPTYPDYFGREGSGYFSMVGLGFHPPTNQYKVVVMCGRRCQILTLGTSSWRTYEVTAPLHRLWFVTCCFCYNGLLYWFISSTFRTENSMLLTVDLGTERVRVHDVFEGDSETGARSMEIHHRCRLHNCSQCKVSQIILLGDSGRTVDIWTANYRKSNHPSFYKEFSFNINEKEEEKEEEEATSSGPPPDAPRPLCIQMSRTLICDEQGFHLYHDLLKQRTDEDYLHLSNRLLHSSSLRPVSLHVETLLSFKDLFKCAAGSLHAR